MADSRGGNFWGAPGATAQNTPTILMSDRGGARQVANPRYIPSGFQQFNGALPGSKWVPPSEISFAALQASLKPYAGKSHGVMTGGDRGGTSYRTFYDSAQTKADMQAAGSWARSVGLVQKKSFLDKVSDAVSTVIQVVTVAGITGGLAGAAGIGPAASSGSATAAVGGSTVAPATTAQGIGMTASAGLPAYSGQIAAAKTVAAAGNTLSLNAVVGAAKSAAQIAGSITSAKVAVDSLTGKKIQLGTNDSPPPGYQLLPASDTGQGRDPVMPIVEVQGSSPMSPALMAILAVVAVLALKG